MGDDTPHWEGLGRIPLKGGPQTDREETLARKGWRMGLPPSGGCDFGGGIAGGGDLHLPPPEHSHTVY